jgi:hypothetical protein
MYARGQAAEARRSFEAVIAAKPGDVDARKGLLELFKRTDDAASSIPVLMELIAIGSSAG